jgi:hypothetical protein
MEHDTLEQLAIKYGIRLDKILFLNNFVKDPKVGNFVLNLDCDNRGGTHFNAIISLKNEIYLFDPFGNTALKKDVFKPKKMFYNNIKLQNINQKNCGAWCLVFLLEGENIKNLKDFNNTLEELKYYQINDIKN